MKAYTPLSLPIKNIDLSNKLDLIVEANNNLVRYDEKLKTLPNANIFLSPLQHKEAIRSSQIEGTQATLDDILKSEADINAHIEDHDTKEVFNYRDAMRYSIEELKKKPLNLNMIKNIQGLLLKNVRGSDKGRGEFRREQVWIGPKGCSIEEADYIPPKWQNLKELLDNWERYLHLKDKTSLVQTAIIHAQFEMIHPFVDGNGRVGRILIPLYLYQRETISEPMFYISGYLEKHRDEYMTSLARISKYEDWDRWINFFLEAVNEQAKENLNTVNQIVTLYEETKETLLNTKSPYQTVILDTLFMYPLFASNRFANNSKMSGRTALRLINKLEELNIIKTLIEKSGNKPAIYIFPKLYEILTN